MSAFGTKVRRDLEAHGVDTTTPSQTRRGVGGNTQKIEAEVETYSQGNKIDKWKTKRRKNKKGQTEYKTEGSTRKTPGVTYEGGWSANEQGSREKVSRMLHAAKGKQAPLKVKMAKKRYKDVSKMQDAIAGPYGDWPTKDI